MWVMLKIRLTLEYMWKLLWEQKYLDATQAVVKLDLPEDKYMLKVLAAGGYSGGKNSIGWTNYDRFNILLD